MMHDKFLATRTGLRVVISVGLAITALDSNVGHSVTRSYSYVSYNYVSFNSKLVS